MQLCKYQRSLTYGIWYGCNIRVRVSALIVCVCLFVCVSALIICKSSESAGECVCASPVASCVFESYRGKRDLLEPDLLDLETLYKASHFFMFIWKAGYGERICGERLGVWGGWLWQVLSWSPWVFIAEQMTCVIDWVVDLCDWRVSCEFSQSDQYCHLEVHIAFVPEPVLAYLNRRGASWLLDRREKHPMPLVRYRYIDYGTHK
jgi:hypothetical protein